MSWILIVAGVCAGLVLASVVTGAVVAAVTANYPDDEGDSPC